MKHTTRGYLLRYNKAITATWLANREAQIEERAISLSTRLQVMCALWRVLCPETPHPRVPDLFGPEPLSVDL
jgi:hypothetical protein